MLYTASTDGNFANAEILDSFGVPGLDPTGGDDCACNFQDGSGVRKADAPKAPDAVWDKSHWDVTNDFSSGPYFGVKNMADMTPRQWDGAVIDPTLFMTEIADPNDVWSGRFVEIYSPDGAGQVIGQKNGLDLYLALTSNTNTAYNSQVKLTGETIGNDGFLIVCNNQDTFASYGGATCDVVSGGTVNSNGDDAYTVSCAATYRFFE